MVPPTTMAQPLQKPRALGAGGDEVSISGWLMRITSESLLKHSINQLSYLTGEIQRGLPPRAGPELDGEFNMARGVRHGCDFAALFDKPESS